jgi:signal transduction histidine kinase
MGYASLADVTLAPTMPGIDVSGDEARERLIEAARLANIGRIVPSVAHQMSTPLAAIALRAESLEHSLMDPARPAPAEKLQRYLKAIAEETQRCKTLLSTLQAFARRPAAATAGVELAPLCRSAVLLVQHEAMRRQVELKLELAEPLPAVAGHGERIGQALLALLLNAIDASPSGGTVELRALGEGNAVVIGVSDEGEGLSEQAIAQLYQPLASTRPPDRAPGLGLMSCRAIAEAHGGTIAWQSLGPRGCRFSLRLPAEGRRGEGEDDGEPG